MLQPEKSIAAAAAAVIIYSRRVLTLYKVVV